MVRVTKDWFPRAKVRRSSDKRLFLWMAFWFLLAMYLLGCLYSESQDKPLFPFDIKLEGSAQ